jgi:N-methylhydantoinase A
MITTIRVSARAAMTSHELASSSTGAGAGQSYDVEPSGHRDVVWYELDATPRATAVYDGSGLRPGARVTGPAIVEFIDTTLVLRHGQVAVVDPWSSIVIDA